MPLPQPRMLGGFAVIPTGSTLIRDVPDPIVRAEIIRRCRMALDVLEDGLSDARDDTATELHETGQTWQEVANRFRASNRRTVLHAQPDAATIFHNTVRRRTRRIAEETRQERARRAA